MQSEMKSVFIFSGSDCNSSDGDICNPIGHHHHMLQPHSEISLEKSRWTICKIYYTGIVQSQIKYGPRAKYQ